MTDNTRLPYQGKIEAYLKEWGSQIDRWQDEAGDDQKQIIADLNTKRQAVRQKLASVKDASEDHWRDLKSDLDHDVEAMKQAVSNARAEFNS